MEGMAERRARTHPEEEAGEVKTCWARAISARALFVAVGRGKPSCVGALQQVKRGRGGRRVNVLLDMPNEDPRSPLSQRTTAGDRTGQNSVDCEFAISIEMPWRVGQRLTPTKQSRGELDHLSPERSLTWSADQEMTMAAMIDWVNGERFISSVLGTAHKARFNWGKADNKARREEIARQRAAGNEARAAQLEECFAKKSRQAMRRKRRREQVEMESDLRRVGAAARRAERQTARRQPPDSLFKQFEATAQPDRPGVKDLYYEWIGRGFSSGAARDYSKAQKRSTSRTTPWKGGEMGRKIQYIYREDALEPVEGNAITNMGDDIEEAIACSKVLEKLEAMARETNGNIYHHVIVGLPHHLTGNERAELLGRLTKPLRDMGLPFCAALHLPDKRGDQRNYHAHIIVSLRPMVRVGEHAWDFAPSKRTSFDTMAGLFLQRKFVARSFNHALVAAGHDARWTWKSRAARGEKSPGNNKKGAERTRAERDLQVASVRYGAARADLFASGAIARDLTMLDGAAAALEATAATASSLLAGTVEVARDAVLKCEEDLARIVKFIAQSKRAASEVVRERVSDSALAEVPEEAEPTGSEQVEKPTTDQALPDPGMATAAKRKRRKKPDLPRIDPGLVAADTEAMKLLEAAGGTPDMEGLRLVRAGILGGRAFAIQTERGRYRISVENEDILEALKAVIRVEAGQAYWRSIVDRLPAPPPEAANWPGLGLHHKELDADVSIETQQAFLGLSGRGR